MWGLQQGATGAMAWHSAASLSILTLSFISGCIFFLWQYAASKRYQNLAPLFPISIAKDRIHLGGILYSLAAGFCHQIFVFALPLRLQVVNEAPIKSAGLYSLPFLGAIAIGASVNGVLSAKQNYTFYTSMFGSTCVLLGSAGLAILGDGLVLKPIVFAFSILSGFGSGMAIASMTLMGKSTTSEQYPIDKVLMVISHSVSLQTNPQEHAIAQSLLSQARVLGGGLGVAAFNAVFNHQLQTSLLHDIPLDQLAKIQTNFEVVDSLDLIQQNLVRMTFASSFADSMRTCMKIATLSLLVALLTYRRRPRTLGQKIREMEDLIVAQARVRLAGADKCPRAAV